MCAVPVACTESETGLVTHCHTHTGIIGSAYQSPTAGSALGAAAPGRGAGGTLRDGRSDRRSMAQPPRRALEANCVAPTARHNGDLSARDCLAATHTADWAATPMRVGEQYGRTRHYAGSRRIVPLPQHPRARVGCSHAQDFSGRLLVGSAAIRHHQVVSADRVHGCRCCASTNNYRCHVHHARSQNIRSSGLQQSRKQWHPCAAECPRDTH